MKLGDLVIIHDHFDTEQGIKMGVYFRPEPLLGSEFHLVFTSGGYLHRLTEELKIIQKISKCKLSSTQDKI